MSKKEDLRIIKTKRNLYEGLMQLLGKNRFEEIKIKDICDISLTSRSTFYDHFNSKYKLLDYLIEDKKNELTYNIENTNLTIKQQYMKLIEAVLDLLDENLNTYRSMLINNNNSIVIDILYNTIYKDIEKSFKEKGIKEEIPIEILTKFYANGVVNVLLLYIQFPNKYKKEELLNYIDKLIPNIN